MATIASLPARTPELDPALVSWARRVLALAARVGPVNVTPESLPPWPLP